MISRDFYRKKRIFITGHTGFKGSWMCKLLTMLGAEVTGYGLEPPTSPSLFQLAQIEPTIHSICGDIRDLPCLTEALAESSPDIVIHMAAQPIVRDSYADPVYTYETNVMGTVNLLEAVRKVKTVRSVVNVTTDKVYKNNEWEWGYRENDAISTCRAGNVIGGGDFANDRIIPDCVRAMQSRRTIAVRNPYSTRPYQHVLEPVAAYLMVAERQYEDKAFAGAYNVGPDDCDCVETGALVDLFCRAWGADAKWENMAEANAPHEASFLKLDCSRIKQVFGWSPRWHIGQAVEKTVAWAKAWLDGEAPGDVMECQIEDYLGKA